jgi:hypothetical protein
VYAAVVIALMTLAVFPNAPNGSGLLAVLLSLPWGLGVVLLLDTVDADLITALGPPLVAMCGLLNSYLLYNALRPRHD